MANNSIAYIEKTMPKVVDKALRIGSLTEALIGGSEIKLDFLDARTVKITKMATTRLQNYNRGGHGSANGKGAVQSTHETFTLSQQRFSAIPLDKLDTLDDGETVFGHLAKEFLDVNVIPEFDAYRFSKLAGYTSVSIGNRKVVSKASLANHIIAEFNAALKWMANNKVKEGDMVIYVSPDCMELIRNTTELYKKLSQSEYRSSVTFAIQNYENKPIVEVPQDEFYTDIAIGDGYYPKSTSKKIHFMIVDKRAPIIVRRLDWTKVYSSDETNLGYVGYEFDNLYYHDLFVPDNKVPCIYCCVSDESAADAANVLLADMVADSAQGKTIAQRILTIPQGILWDKVDLYTTNGTAPAVGSSFTADGDVAEVVANGQEVVFKAFTPNASHNILVATFNGKVVAVSKDFEDDLPVGA